MYSVLISVYSKEKANFLNKALNSLVNQTLIPGEIVIVKDGLLNPDLDEVIDSFSSKEKNKVKVLSLKENVGLGKALQLGLLETNFDIVARMDSDDISYENRFKLQYEFLSDNKHIDIVGSNIDEFRKDFKVVDNVRIVPENHYDISKRMKWINGMNHVTVMFRKKSIIDSGNYNSFNGFEDYHLWIRMILNNKKFYNIQKSLVAVRIGNDMIGRRKGLSYFKTEWKFIRFLKEKKYISYIEMIVSGVSKFIVRISPRFTILFFYKFFLRSNK
tara:strand:- start:4974 stop:5792 length:819 start_codon:yes stop_codon:yes gene_type:complete